MGVPIVTTFIPLIAISLVLGVVSIVTYTNMHEKQMKQSMENAISGVLTYLERNTAGPFFELTSDCRILANNVESQGVSVFRGNGTPIYPSGNTPPSAAQLAAYQTNHVEMMSTSKTIFGGVYINMYQMYRTGRRSGASPTSTDPYDFEWGMSGRFEDEGRHYYDGSNYVAFSIGEQWPNFTSTDAVVRTNDPTAGKTPVEMMRTLVAANSSWPPPMSRQWWYVRILPNGDEKLYIMITHGIVLDFDATSGFAINGFAMDFNAAFYLNAVVRDLPIERSDWTVINPHTAEVVGTTFASMEPRWIRVIPGDVSSYRLYNIYSCPEERLRNAMKAVDTLGALPSIEMKNHVLQPDGDDIVGVRPLRMVGLDWLIISVTERGLYFEEGEKTSTDAIILCSVLLVVAVLVAVATAVLLARPLSDLGDRMALTAEMQEDPDELKPSIVSEIGSMQMSYKLMKGQLDRMKAYLPQSLLSGDMGEDEEDEGSVQGTATGSIASSAVPKSTKSGADTESARSRSSRGSSRTGAVTGLNMTRSLVAKRVTVGVFNLSSFLKGVKSGNNPAVVSKLQSDYLNLVSEQARNQRGVVDFFQGDHIVVTWNAVQAVASAPKRATEAAMEITKAAQQHSTLPCVTVGLAHGEALVGNSGTDRMQRFNIIGNVYSQAVDLERIAARRVRTSGEKRRCILVPRSMLSEVELHYYHKVLDVILLPNTNQRSIVSSIERAKTNEVSDEWMYELQNSGNADPFAAANAAYLALQNKEDEFDSLVEKLPEAEREAVLRVRAKVLEAEAEVAAAA